MPPRMRSNRAEKMEYQRMTVLGFSVNTVSLPALPDELLLLILSFFPTCRIPEETRDLPEKGMAPRHKTLLILTMTCRDLRRVCLPFLWQRVEARAGMEGVDDVIPTHKSQPRTRKGKPFLYESTLAREVLRQLETVTVRQPKYAVYVNIINLDIGVHSTDTILQKVLDSLELLPRLHTVRLRAGSGLSGNDYQRARAVLSSWKPTAPLTSIKRWYSNQLLVQLIKFCPNLHTAGGLPYDVLELRELEMELAHPMTAIERLENVKPSFFMKMSAIAVKFPNLRHMSLKTVEYRGNSDDSELEPMPVPPPFGHTLAPFRHLDSVEFHIDSRSWPTDESWRDGMSAGPIDVLKNIQKRDTRVKRLGLREWTSDLTRRVCDLVIPLRGIPTWTESEVEVRP